MTSTAKQEPDCQMQVVGELTLIAFYFLFAYGQTHTAWMLATA